MDNPLFAGGISTSLLTENDYITDLRGSLPAGLRGSVLYKNGPGLFERDGVRKRAVVDGDGMVNGYFFQPDGSIRFVNRFVRTAKYNLEEDAGRYLYPTWTTPAPGPLGPEEAANSSQAGVSVWNMFGKLLAFDESNFPESLDFDSLETLGTDVLGVNPGDTVFSAHPKIDGRTGEVSMFGIDYRTQELVLTVFASSGTLIEQQRYPMNPVRYIHDFFATSRYIVAAVHPAVLSFERFIGQGESLRDALEWDAGLGMRWLVFERGSQSAPVEIEAPARWMWHTANMYESGSELVCDWIGYDDAHFLSPDSIWQQVMEGSAEKLLGSGRVRRTVIDPTRGTITADEVLSDAGNYEFAQVPYAQWGAQHEKLWTAVSPADEALWTAVRSVNVRTGAEDTFDFGSGHVVTEPNLADGSDGHTYALVEVARAATGRNSLAVFDADRLADGPIVEADLRHHLPVRFHGHWSRR